MFRRTLAISVVGIALLSGVSGGRHNQGAISDGMNGQAAGGTLGPERHSCSTFLLPTGDTLLVGHNADDYYVIPGAVVVNNQGGSQADRNPWRAQVLRRAL
jgi:hypothetical protein